MVKKSLLIMMLLALFAPWAAMAQETLTVHDENTTTNSYVPVWGLWADNSLQCEIVYPASELEDMAGGTISALKFYTNSTSTNIGTASASNNWDGTFTIFMKEVEATTLSVFTGATGATTVLEAQIGVVNGEMTIEFSTPYTYGGGNLLVGVYYATGGHYCSVTWVGNPMNGASIYGRSGQSYSATQGNFIPKTTFTYTPGEAPATPKPTGFAVSNVLHNQATLSWTENGTATSWQICVNDDETNLITTTDNPHTLIGLTPTTAYTVKVRSVGTPNSDWSTSKSFNTTAQATAVGDSWSDDFEGTECGWELINGTLTNANWVWGTAVNNGGSHAIYISNDGGTTNNYNTSGYAKVFATKLLNFTEGKFTFSYDWKGTGESTYDFMRVALVPASQTLTAGTDHSTIGTTTLPTGWIALDGSNILNQQSTWTSKEVTTNVTAGNYYLVLAWRQDSGGGTNPPAAVDNVSITRMACPYDVTGLAVASSPAVTESTATVTWTAGDATQWQVAYSTNSTFDGATEEIVSTASYNMTGLTANTKYYVKVRAYCGGEDYGTWCNAISFYTECPQYTTIPAEGWTINFDDMTGVTSGTTNNLPHCWNYINTSTNSTYKGYPVVYNYQSSSHSGNNHLRFLSYYYSSSSDPADQYAILPAMENVNTLRVKFYARANSTGSSSAVYDATFKVGVMEGTDASTFTEIASYTPESTTYQLYTVPLSSYTGTGTRIAFMIEAAQNGGASYTNYYRSVFIDDITVEEIPDCLEPTDLAEVANTATTSSVTFGWTAVNNESTWKVQYKKSDATDWTTVAEPVTTNPYTLPGLDHSSTYQVRVAAWCTPSNPEGISSYTEPITVQTECEAITDFPVSYGFETSEGFPANASTPTTNQLGACWRNEATVQTGNNSTRVWGTSTSNKHEGSQALILPDKGNSSNPAKTMLVFPEMEFTNTDGYIVSFWIYRSGTSSNPEGFKLYVSDCDTIGPNAVELGHYSRNYGIAYPVVESASGWYQYETEPITRTGSVYIIFEGQSYYGSATYVDDITVEVAPTCARPSGLACTAKTAHTATFTWAKGAETQNAWQISYGTTADFNPDNGTIVDVTNNEGSTINNIPQANTNYYAYVRANCGNGDYSPWSRKSCTFKTTLGNAVPTGFAVDNASIVSDGATVNWTGVATNDLHESFELYYSGLSTMPETLEADSLITGITAATHTFTSLDSEKTYYVWVRDNCGNDGLSSWSSKINFTTASACQTPDGLAASNVTNESAKLTWNTYGLNDFNLQYRISGEEWDANNIISHVNTPYTLNPPLTGSTTYEVRVQAACNTDVWSNAISFKTQCDHEPFPWSENFDEWTSKSECWSFLSGQYNHGNGPATTSSSAWSLTSSSYGDITLSGKALTMNLYSTYRYWAVTPVIDITTDDAVLTVDVAVAAWSSATPNYDDNDTLAFAISTDGGATFTSLRELDGAELNTLGNSYTTIYVPVTGYNGQAVRFAIFGGSISGTSPYDNRCVIDNVTVIETPSCYPVSTLSAATNVTYNSAKLSWALVDDTQDEWTVQYATNATFNEGVDTKTATTNTNYELTDLTPETHYWVRVKAACSTTDDWSNAVDFTTDVFCAVSVPTAANITQTTADLSWTGASDSYNIQYRTAAYMNELWFEGFENETAYNQWTLNNCVSGSTRSTEAKRTDDYGFKFAYNGSTSGITPPQYLISPDLSAYTTNDVTVEFYYMKSSTWNETFNVGWSSTTNSTDAFTWDDHGDYSATQLWQAYTHTIPAGTKYVAIAYTADDQLSMYIDDFTIGAPIAAGTWQNATSETASKQLTGLAAGTKYDVQVQGVCDGTAGNWSESINFTTLPFTKTIEGNKWYFIASPVGTAPTNMDDLTDLYFYDEQDHFWRNKENTANAAGFDFAIGTGYLCANADPTLETTPETLTLTFTGAPVVDDTYEVPVTYHATTSGENPQTNSLAGWNLVGNPFTCDAYIAESYFVAPATNGGQAVAREGAIACCEGVMVKVEEENTEEGVGYITFSKTPLTKSKGGVEMILTQHATDRNGLSTGSIDNAIVSFNEGSQLEKFVFNADNAKLYIPQNGKDYAIVSTEGQGEMPVSFKAAENGQYTLTVIPEGVNMAYLHLIDNMTGADVDLLATPSYTFNARTTDYSSRFRLVFATGINNDSDNFAFCSNGNWIISNEGEATLQVIDVTGRVLSSETVNGSVSKAINAAPGVYMIRLINGENVKVQKIVVR